MESKLYLFKTLLKKNANIIADKEIPQYRKIKEIASKNKFNIQTISNNKGNLEIISHKYQNEKQVVEIKYNKIIYKFKTRINR